MYLEKYKKMLYEKEFAEFQGNAIECYDFLQNLAVIRKDLNDEFDYIYGDISDSDEEFDKKYSEYNTLLSRTYYISKKISDNLSKIKVVIPL